MDFKSSNDLEFGMAVIALLMFAAMTFAISILDYRLRFFVLRMPGI